MEIIYSKIYSLIVHNYSENNAFWDYNLKLYEMIDMHSEYDNMHKNGIFYASICINNRIIVYVNCMLSITNILHPSCFLVNFEIANTISRHPSWHWPSALPCPIRHPFYQVHAYVISIKWRIVINTFVMVSLIWRSILIIHALITLTLEYLLLIVSLLPKFLKDFISQWSIYPKRPSPLWP